MQCSHRGSTHSSRGEKQLQGRHSEKREKIWKGEREKDEKRRQPEHPGTLLLIVKFPFHFMYIRSMPLPTIPIVPLPIQWVDSGYPTIYDAWHSNIFSSIFPLEFYLISPLQDTMHLKYLFRHSILFQSSGRISHCSAPSRLTPGIGG